MADQAKPTTRRKKAPVQKIDPVVETKPAVNQQPIVLELAQQSIAAGQPGNGLKMLYEHFLAVGPHPELMLAMHRAASEVMVRPYDWDWRPLAKEVLYRFKHSLLGMGTAFTGESALACGVYTPADELYQHRVSDQQRMQKAPCAISSYMYERPGPERKIRIGFIGCDFFEQATSYLMTGMVAALDRNQYEVFAYEHGSLPAANPYRDRVIASYDTFRRIDGVAAQAVADQIHRDGIDVLFSIKSPWGQRMDVLDLRPVACQVHYLYYPATSGAISLDYMIADSVTVPYNMEANYRERIIRVDGCYQPNDSQRNTFEDLPRSHFGLRDDDVVIGCFNQAYKHTPERFDLWMQLLHMDPRRRLWLMPESEEVARGMLRQANARGIGMERLIFGQKLHIVPHMSRLRTCDLILDTYPYGGHTLTSDALWAGTPVVTQMGKTFASRVAASLLIDVGLRELVTETDEDYLKVANQILCDSLRRQRLREWLDTNRDKFNLFNPVKYAERFDEAIKQILHHRWG